VPTRAAFPEVIRGFDWDDSLLPLGSGLSGDLQGWEMSPILPPENAALLDAMFDGFSSEISRPPDFLFLQCG
jgi:hypothetical protein